MPTSRHLGSSRKRFEPPLVVGSFDATEVTERPDNEGVSHLHCNCPQFAMTKPGDESFCEHLRIVLEKNWDGHPQNAPMRDLPRHIWVPVFQHPGLQVQVILEKVDDKLRKVEILRTFEPTQSHPTGGTEPEFIGFIQIGQGRGAIRTLVSEWLIEQATKPYPKCRAPYHGTGTKKTVMDTRSKHALANLADLLVTGSCRICNEDAAIPDV